MSITEAMRAVQRDCADDASRVDGTPFTPRGVGETFGATLAMLAVVARAVEMLKAEVDGLQRTLDARTEHLV